MRRKKPFCVVNKTIGKIPLQCFGTRKAAQNYLKRERRESAARLKAAKRTVTQLKKQRASFSISNKGMLGTS